MSTNWVRVKFMCPFYGEYFRLYEVLHGFSVFTIWVHHCSRLHIILWYELFSPISSPVSRTKTPDTTKVSGVFPIPEEHDFRPSDDDDFAIDFMITEQRSPALDQDKGFVTESILKAR